MILLKRILILEDNLLVLSKLLAKLSDLEGDQPYDLSLIILTDHEMVKDFINANSSVKFDIILLDRDDKLNRSFHILDIERLGVEKVIGISTVGEYNDELKARGVTRFIEKDLSEIDKFANEVVSAIEIMLSKMSLI